MSASPTALPTKPPASDDVVDAATRKVVRIAQRATGELGGGGAAAGADEGAGAEQVPLQQEQQRAREQEEAAEG